MWSDLTPITLFTQMMPVILSSSKAPSIFPLQGLCTCSFSAQRWYPQLSVWLDPLLSSHHCSQVISSERCPLTRPPPSASPSPSPSPLPCFALVTTFVTTWHFIFLSVSLVVICPPHLECRFHDTRDFGCSIYRATPSLNCAQHSDRKCAQRGVV